MRFLHHILKPHPLHNSFKLWEHQLNRIVFRWIYWCPNRCDIELLIEVLSLVTLVHAQVVKIDDHLWFSVARLQPPQETFILFEVHWLWKQFIVSNASLWSNDSKKGYCFDTKLCWFNHKTCTFWSIFLMHVGSRGEHTFIQVVDSLLLFQVKGQLLLGHCNPVLNLHLLLEIAEFLDLDLLLPHIMPLVQLSEVLRCYVDFWELSMKHNCSLIKWHTCLWQYCFTFG